MFTSPEFPQAMITTSVFLQQSPQYRRRMGDMPNSNLLEHLAHVEFHGGVLAMSVIPFNTGFENLGMSTTER